MKTLLLMRHGKSDWDADFDTDHERPINRRGVRSARLIGRLLADRQSVPDWIVSSTAVRARTTVDLAMEAGAWDSHLELDETLYTSGPAAVLEVGSRTPDVQRLMLVGHQPVWSILASGLTGGHVDMKTAAVAIIGLSIETWSDLPNANGSLEELINPRPLFGSVWDRPD